MPPDLVVWTTKFARVKLPEPSVVWLMSAWPTSHLLGSALALHDVTATCLPAGKSLPVTLTWSPSWMCVLGLAVMLGNTLKASGWIAVLVAGSGASGSVVATRKQFVDPGLQVPLPMAPVWTVYVVLIVPSAAVLPPVALATSQSD